MAEKASTAAKFLKKYKHGVLWVKHIAIVTVYGLIFFFLMLNIIFSQDMPPLYSKLIHEEPGALVDYMKQAKNLAFFPQMLPEMSASFHAHEVEIFQEERLRQETITNLEEFLVQNPKSTEVLYALYLLYNKEGDDLRANTYLLRAQALDPKRGR